MRILHFITLLELGGAQQNTLHTCRRLAERGHDVWLASGAGGQLDEQAQGAPFEHVSLEHLVRPISARKDPRAFLEMVALVHRLRPDVVHTHSSKAGMLGRLAGRLGGAKAVVHSVHGWSFSPFHPPLRRRVYIEMERVSHWACDHLIAVSRENIEEGLKLGIVPRKAHSVIRSGIDFEEFSPNGPGRTEVRREWGVADDEVLVVNVSCAKPQKDPVSFVHAAGLAARQEPSLRFALVGDGELRKNLAVAKEQEGLGDRLILAGWRHDVPEILRAADVVALTSLWEGLPRVAVQARSARKPVVATPVNGTPELIVDGKNGLLRPTKDPAAHASAYLALARDPDLRARLGGCTDEALAEFDQETMVLQQEELYLRLLGREQTAVPNRDEAAPAIRSRFSR